MKFSTAFIATIITSAIAVAAPTGPVDDSVDGTIPENAIIAAYQLGSDESFLLGEQDDQKMILLINNTIAYPDGQQKRSDYTDEETSLHKRWHWLSYRIGAPIFKREDDPDHALNKRWHWLSYRIGAPIFKREDGDENDHELNKRWHWLTYRIGSPLF